MRAAALLLVATGCLRANSHYCDESTPCDAGAFCDVPAHECVPAACAASGAQGPHYQYSNNSLTLPTTDMPFDLDVDGDGRRDNQVKIIFSELAGLQLDLQEPIKQAVLDGQVLELFDFQAKDLSNGCLQAGISRSAAHVDGDPFPKFDGNDRFHVDPDLQGPAILQGQLADGWLSTTLPPEVSAHALPVVLAVPFGHDSFLKLPIFGAHLQGQVDARQVLQGELHGALSLRDIRESIVPQMAAILTMEINRDPTSAPNEKVIHFLEDPIENPVSKKKCMETPAECCQLPANRRTCEISGDEILANPAIDLVLTPDVQVLAQGKDGAESWHPIPDGPSPDAISIGLGFTAVKASFQ